MALLYPERLVSHGLTQLSKDRAMGEGGTTMHFAQSKCCLEMNPRELLVCRTEQHQA